MCKFSTSCTVAGYQGNADASLDTSVVLDLLGLGGVVDPVGTGLLQGVGVNERRNLGFALDQLEGKTLDGVPANLPCLVSTMPSGGVSTIRSTYVAVKQPDTGVVGREAENQEARSRKHGDVAAGWVGEVQLVGAGVGGGSLLAQDVEVVAVEVDRVSLWVRVSLSAVNSRKDGIENLQVRSGTR